MPLANAEVIRHVLLENIPTEPLYSGADRPEVSFFAGCQKVSLILVIPIDICRMTYA